MPKCISVIQVTWGFCYLTLHSPFPVWEVLVVFKEQKKSGIFFLLSREFPNVVFVRVESKIPVVAIPDRCTLSFKRTHCCA